MEVRVVDAKVESVESELVAVGVTSPLKEVPQFLKKIDEKLGGAIAHVVKSKGFEGEFGQMRAIGTLGKLPAQNILLVGLGKSQDLTKETLRKASGLSARVIRDSLGITVFTTALHEVDVPKTTLQERVQVVAEGTVLGSYQYIKYKTIEADKIKRLKSVGLLGKGFDAALKKGVTLAESANFVRDLQNEPASNLHPKEMAEHAESLQKIGVKVTVYDKKQIEKMGLNALLAVNRGSMHEPRLVVMEYDGKGKKKVALVGKGITFDSGGLQIKPDEAMMTMKDDMSGAAVVMGAVRAAALLKLPVHVVGVFASTENMPGMDAYKPGDVVKTYSGKTIEIAHTDAEGRVILSDALA